MSTPPFSLTMCFFLVLNLPASETAIEGSQAFYSSLSICIYKLLLITFTSQGFMEMR